MKDKVNGRNGDYYQNKMFLFSIPYFVLNLFDLITTRIALATSPDLYELNPFYYNPYFAPLKLFSPVILILCYLTLYHLSKSEHGKKTVGLFGCYCIMAMTVIYAIICTNNFCHYIFAVAV